MVGASKRFIKWFFYALIFRRLSSVLQIIIHLSSALLDFLFMFSRLNRFVFYFCLFVSYVYISFAFENQASIRTDTVWVSDFFCICNFIGIRDDLMFFFSFERFIQTLPINWPGVQIFRSGLRCYWNIRPLLWHRISPFIAVTLVMMWWVSHVVHFHFLCEKNRWV